MTYWNYICDTCGFMTEEQLAIYQCPVCGSQMRFRKGGYRGEKGVIDKKANVYFVEAWIVLVISGGLFPIGIVISIVLVLITRKILNNHYRDNAIRLYSTEILNNSWKNYTCPYCGNTYNGQRPNCPYCGGVVNYPYD